MKKGKKEIMTIEFSIEVEVKRAKKFSRELLGLVPCTKTHKLKKGGAYNRKVKHRDRVVDNNGSFIIRRALLRLGG